MKSVNRSRSIQKPKATESTSRARARDIQETGDLTFKPSPTVRFKESDGIDPVTMSPKKTDTIIATQATVRTNPKSILSPKNKGNSAMPPRSPPTRRHESNKQVTPSNLKIDMNMVVDDHGPRGSNAIDNISNLSDPMSVSDITESEQVPKGKARLVQEESKFKLSKTQNLKLVQ